MNIFDGSGEEGVLLGHVNLLIEALGRPKLALGRRKFKVITV